MSSQLVSIPVMDTKTKNVQTYNGICLTQHFLFFFGGGGGAGVALSLPICGSSYTQFVIDKVSPL